MNRKFPVAQQMILLLGDAFIITMVAYGAIQIVNLGWNPVDVPVHYNMLPVMLVVLGILFNINGLFSLAYKTYSEVFLSLTTAMLNMWVIMMAISFFLREFSYSRSVLLVAVVLQLILLAIWKYVFWRMENAFIRPRNVLIVGSQVQCERIVVRLQAQPQLQYHVKYVCDECGDEQWEAIVKDIDMVIVGEDRKMREKMKLVHYCHIHEKQVFIIPDFYEVFCSTVDLDKIDDIPVFRPRDLKPTLEQRLLKRLLDIAFSTAVLLLLSPVLLIVAVAIKATSPGPVLYSQVRSGLYGREFQIYKFRSMRADAEDITGPVLASENDTRVTPLGRVLRSTRLDELPQFFNVLRGDMSVVGPRPERPFFVKQFERAIPEYVYRHNVKPGITGLAQVRGKYTTTPYGKLVYDLIYIQQCNVITDLVIILQTLQAMLSKASSQGVKEDLARADLSKYQI